MSRPGKQRADVGKAKNSRATFAKLIRYSKRHMWAVLVALIAAACGAALQIIGPDFIRNLTDEITKGLGGGAIDMGAVWNFAIILVCFYSAALFLNLFEGMIMTNVTQRIAKRMRTDVSGKINRLPFGHFQKTSYGDVLSRVTNDTDTVGQSLNQSIGTLVMSFTMFVGAIIMMFITNWAMAVTAIVASLLGFVIMAVIVTLSQKFFKAQQETLGDLNGQIEETYTGHNVVRVYNAQGKAKQKFEETNHKLYQSGWRAQFFSGLMFPLMMFVGNIGYVAVCVVGALLALNGTISFGVIVAFMIYVRLFNQPLGEFAQGLANLQRTAAAGERIFEFLGEPELEDESQKPATLQNIKGAVDFKNVRFGYEENTVVIKDFTAHIKPGQKVAIVGPTGAGKTTIVNLLMRFHEVDSGEILIDGVSTNRVTRENVHEQFCMVLQDTWVFEGTIRDNVIYSMPNITDEQVIDACKAVGLHHFIMTLPNGYDTVLDDKASLSEGEKQLLTIARAIIKNAPLLILDEATSSVDTRTERKVQAAMDKLMHGRTSFVIAHRLSTIKNADTILVMRDGDIIESGKHKQLLEQRGFYADLYNSQFEVV